VRRRFLVVVGLTLVAACWTGVAHAGFVVGPPSGATTSPTPTFSAYLEPSEQGLATIYVAADTQMSGSFFPTHLLGSCDPSTPTGAQFTFSCAPSYYSIASFGSSLPPGTYYWWLTFYHTDPGSFFSTLHISGPASFTIPTPVAPSNAGLVTPYDAAVVSSSPTLTIQEPAGAVAHIYLSLSATTLGDGSPAGGVEFGCQGIAPADGNYTCQPASGQTLTPGLTYYWWAILTINGTNWIYGPRHFSVQAASPPPPSGGGGNSGPHTIGDAPLLPALAHFTGESIKQTKLSQAAYQLSKLLGAPKSIAVACWSEADWPGISGDSGDGYYSIYGLYQPLMPHWIHLSPSVCRGMETLLYHRPQYPNKIVASDVDTVTHEMVHAMGVVNEAQTECFAMQLSIVMAVDLHVPLVYSQQLARLTLLNYFQHPARYIDTVRCQENGAWDLFKNHPSPPWHDFAGY
jgi:hypothetical protein